MPTLPQNGAPHKLAEVDWAAALEADMLVVVRRSSPRCSARAMRGTRRGWDTATGPRCGR